MHSNLKAFLDMLAVSELGEHLLRKSDNGYDVLVGGKLFSGYADHPRKLVELRRKKASTIYSTAAGRYQILKRYFDHYKKTLKLKDFSPAAQDAIAVQMIREQKALADIEAGRIVEAIDKCRNIWASLPGAGYGQHENDLLDLVVIYLQAGGVVTSDEK